MERFNKSPQSFALDSLFQLTRSQRQTNLIMQQQFCHDGGRRDKSLRESATACYKSRGPAELH